MKRHEYRRKLREAGYWLKDGKKHEKWTNGSHTVAIPRGRTVHPETIKAVLRRIRRANDLD